MNPVDATQQDEVLYATLQRLLAPLVRLCLANGVRFATVDEMLKDSFVQQALALHPEEGAGHGTVSRISTATGITRREVTRLIRPDAPARSVKPPLATQLFARWTTDPAYLDQAGAPRPLTRQGPPPNFDTLAQSITRDVHPRSLLDELIRLGVARYDQEQDLVTSTNNDFVPKSDSKEMLTFLADNVGDHFDAAIANVLKGGGQHFEQAIFADELSTESLMALRPLVTAQWQALCEALIPEITTLIDADAAAGRPQNERVRIGMYTFSETTPGAEASATRARKPLKE